MTGVSSYLVDADIILRFLLNDNETFSPAARKLVARARAQKIILEVPFMALIETVFVLTKVYKRNRETIAAELIKVLTTPGIHFRGPAWALDALEEFGEKNCDFGDAVVAAEARLIGLPVASFDTDFDGFVDVVRFEPD